MTDLNTDPTADARASGHPRRMTMEAVRAYIAHWNS